MSRLSLYEECAIAHGEESDARIMQCMADYIQEQQQQQAENMNEWLLVLCGSLVFSMQAGFAMLCAGSVRKKNLQNTMLKNLLDVCGVAMAFYAVGYALAFGSRHGDDDTGVHEKTFVGGGDSFFLRDSSASLATIFFQYTMSAASVTIVAGALEERCQMRAYLLYSLFLGGFVYPVIAHALWSDEGYLSPFVPDPMNKIGAIDFAGSGVIHLTGGTTALIATYLLGARRGRFHDNKGRVLKTPQKIVGHSYALQVLGSMILWFGWFGFNSGSALLLPSTALSGTIAARAVTNTSLSGGAGALTVLATRALLTWQETGQASYDLVGTMNGGLSGLVAITACSGTVYPTMAVLTGLVSGWLYLAASHMLIRFRLDDAVDAVPVHLFNGAWGLIATGLFSAPQPTKDAYGMDEHVGWFYSLGRQSMDATLLVNQMIAIFCIMSWCLITMFPFFYILNQMDWLRTDILEELVGLDKMYNGVEIDEGGGPVAEDVTKQELKEIYQQQLDSKDSNNNKDAVTAASTSGPERLEEGRERTTL